MHNKQVLFILLCIWQVLLFAQPVNDDCSDAIEIPVTGNCISPPTYSNSDATVSGTDPVPSCWTPDETVWFTFTPTTGAVMISTNFAGSLSNTQVAVFAGSCGAFTELSCQEDLDAGLGITDVMLYVDGLSAGTTYYIMVDGFGGADGEFGICVEDMSPYPSPSGDDCPEAIFLCEEEDLVVVPDGTGGDGTLEEVPSCFGSGEIASWWYTFTAANTGTLTFDITPSGATNFDWAFYDISGSPGSMCNLSDELACNSAVTTGVTGAGCAGIACEPTLSLIAGHTYALLINRETAAFSSGFTLSFGGTVNFDSPETEFEYDPVVCVGESDGFEVEGGGDGMYYWSFGDGGVSTGDEPNHTYTSAGTYEVVLISFSPGGCYAVATETVIVSDGPDLSIDPEDPVICLGDGVTLDLSYVLTEDCEPLVFIMDEGYDIPEGGVLSIPIPVSGVAPGVMTADLLESVCIDVEHDTDSEVDIWLECPDGTQIELSTDNGGTGNDYNGTCFVLSGAPPVTSGTAPFAGSYLPEQPLSDFAGCTSNGIWYLNITDDTPGGGEGSIEFASLTFACDNTPDIVWSPATGLSSTTVEDPYASPVVTTTYTVTVTDGSGCTADTTVTVTVVDGASAGFIYTGSPYCPDDSDPLPVLDAGAVSGTWSATPAGLVIDAVTGAVDLSVSVPGTYTITNAIGAIGSCPPTSATFEIVIGEDAAILLDDDFCAGDTYILPDGTSTTTGGSFVFNLTAASGCDSVITLTLVAYSATASTIDASVCSGAAYVLPDGSTTTTAGTYTTTLTNAFGCDSVVTTNLTVDPAVVTDISGSICDGDTYTLPDGSTTGTGGIFSFTFVSAAGCDSIVTVDLTVNAVSTSTEDVSICDGGSYTLPDGTIATTDGTYISTLTSALGCDSIITTNVTVTDAYSITLSPSICDGDVYTLPDGSTTGTGGIFSFTFVSAAGCDSIVTVDLTVNAISSTTEDVSICDGGSYTLPDGTIATTDGTYISTLTSAFGCDSIITTNLSVTDAYSITLSPSICDGDVYTLPDGSTTGTGGIFSFTFVSAAGCDSIVTVDLTVNAASTSTEDVSICDGGSYTLPDGTVVTTNGTYVSTLTSIAGCDSIITTNVTVTDAYSITLSPSICDGDTYTLPDGSTTGTGGIFSFTFVSAAGCDSIVTVDLTVNTVSSTTEDVSICDGGSYTLPDGTIATTDGTYISTLTSAFGCDSIITTNVTVTDAYSITLTPSICGGDTYTLPDGSTTTSSGIFSFTFVSAAGCDSIVTVDLTVNAISSTTEDVSICDGGSYTLPDGTIATTDGTYTSTLTSATGCDSIVTTNIIVTDMYLISLSPVICEGDLYVLPDGSVTDLAGSWSFTFTSVVGCDSMVVVDLEVNPVYENILPVSLCEGESIVLPDGTLVDDPVSGIYTYTFISAAGCDSIVGVDLVVDPVDSVVLSPAICSGESYTLPDGSTTSSEGDYFYVFTADSGCDSLVTVNLVVVESWDMLIDTTICSGDSLLLPDATWASTDGTYVFDLMSSGGCDSVVTINLLLEMLPELSISTVDDAFCLDAGIQEIAVSPAGGVLSGAGIAGGFFDPELAGSGGPFWITYSYSTATGCLSSDSISVWVNDLPVVSFDAPPFICLEADPLLLSGDPAGGSFYGDGMADGYFVPSLSDTNVAAIYYTYTDAAGCTGTWTESISILTNVVDAGPDQVIEQGDSTMLLASGTGSLSWSPNGSLSCVDCSHPVASPQTTTTYTLTSTDPNGCIAVDQVTVTVIPSEEYTVFVPNTFTPNGDGANDLFLLYGYNLDLVLSFRIYDRWGQIVYLDEQFDPYDNQRGWDGSFQGQPVNAGVYAWVAEVRTKAGKQVIQYGNVTLLR
ncbi:MAG: gliding motility-associated C-terminal domain-containing protein [Chitinophagales bacterium]|nr:gliding motility-associated C-terminal domain-containing protein [Chitinophagales bacterium]